MTFVKVNNVLYPATIKGYMQDPQWQNRESKAITMNQDYYFVSTLFVDGTKWSIVEKSMVMKTNIDENGNTITTSEEVEKEYDNSMFSIAGPITDFRDGTITVKMGKATELEEAYELLYGGI